MTDSGKNASKNPAKNSAKNSEVTLYGTAWCEVARDLRIYLTQQKVDYTFLNVENNPQDEAAALTMNEGKYSVPVLVVGERTMRNPDLGVLGRELRKQGLLEDDNGNRQSV